MYPGRRILPCYFQFFGHGQEMKNNETVHQQLLKLSKDFGDSVE